MLEVPPIEAGDYAAALREWKPLAEQGNAAAQELSASCTPTAGASRRTMRRR